MLRLLVIVTIVAATSFKYGSAALAHPCQVQITGDPITGIVSKLAGGGTFLLKGSDRKYRLSGTARPLIPKQNQPVDLYRVKLQADRYGVIPVQGFHGKTWLQGEAIRTGEVIFYAFDENSACVNAMREAEASARREKQGLWEKETIEFNAIDVGKLLERKGALTLVKGTVLSVGDRRRRVYLNFGKKWSQDFTISVVKQGTGAFKEETKGALGRLSTLKGKTVRIRGILEDRQGPLIRLVDEAQIEILD